MILKELVSTCVIKNEWSNKESLNINKITQYIEDVTKNSLFICINNTKYDGHDYIHEAIKKGASAIVVDHLPEASSFNSFLLVSDTNKSLAQIAAKFYNYPSQEMAIIGVTGTNGKTTTTFLINQVLERYNLKSGLIGTMYIKIGDKILEASNTTPHTVQLQRFLEKMKQEDVTHCVMEVTSHGLRQERTLGIDFNVAVFTNLTQDHLDFHSNMNEYFEAKSTLFRRLGNGFSEKIKAAIINIDDEYGEKLIPLSPANVYTYGCKGRGDIQANDIIISETGTTFTLSLFEKKWAVRTKMIGLFNVYNYLAAFSACFALGLDPDKIITILGDIPGVRGRFESVPNEKGITAIIDYAHTPDALINALTTARSLTKGDIYCVAGCGGDRDRGKRPLMAEVVVKYATLGIFTSDDPRTENPAKIVEQMVLNISKDNYEIEINRKIAIEKALRMAKPGDTVLVAGRGHETVMTIGKIGIHLDDREVVNNFFNHSKI